MNAGAQVETRSPAAGAALRSVRAWLCALCAAAGPAAGAPPDALEAGEHGVVATVVDGDTVVLTSGLAVRLVGLQAPKLAFGRRGFEDWPLAGESRDALAAFAGGRAVTLRYGGARRDRYRRALAHLVRGDGLWIQGAMLRAGMARVYTFADNRALAAEMYAAERAARAAGRGIWSHPRYRVRAPGELDDAIGSFQVVEGRVLAAEIVRSGRLYVNFGEDWRSDFTIAVAPRDRKRFEAAWAGAGLAPVSALAGRRIRVRGWLRARNGPLVEADHPEQIELADPPGAIDAGRRSTGGPRP